MRHNLTQNDTVLTGDFNICLLKEEYCDMTKRFVDTMKSLHFYPIISRPTRIDNNDTVSVIDHIWLNKDMSSHYGIVLADITDHFPVFCTLMTPEISENNLTKIQFRDMSQNNLAHFQSCINTTDWTMLLNSSSDINHQTETFLATLDKFYDTCFPLMTKFLSAKRLSKPWLTKGILKSIEIKHTLFKRVKQQIYDRATYLAYRRTLTSLIRIAKQNYFTSKFERCKHDIKQTWDVINSAIRPGKKRTPSFKLIQDNTTITNPTEISNAFNQHFANIGKKLKASLNVPANQSFEQYLPPQNP